MNDGGYKLIVVEGEKREKKLFDEIEKFFFKEDRLKYINLPAKQNLYMLWKTLKDDDFQTDIVEILRDNVSGVDKILAGITRDEIDEVYLFFDLDIHQDNVHGASSYDVISDMLDVFDNETEFGKLYISYPMIEAFRDLNLDGCHTYTGLCAIDNKDMKTYKKMSGINNSLGIIDQYNKDTWQKIIETFALRISCLFSLSKVIDYETYRKEVSPLTVYKKQLQKYLPNATFILSAVPEFILDYFKIDFWRSWIKIKKFKYCNKC